MKNTLRAAIARKLEAHKLTRRLKQIRQINRAPTPWLDAFAAALQTGLSEDEALEDLSNKHEQQNS